MPMRASAGQVPRVNARGDKIVGTPLLISLLNPEPEKICLYSFEVGLCCLFLSLGFTHTDYSQDIC